MRRRSFSRAALAAAVAFAVAGCAGVQAHAPAPAQAGLLADIEIVDRDSGERLPIYQHQGRRYVAGVPGRRYAIAVTNRTAQRVLAVMAVDGINAVSGETAAWHQTGYVLHPWQRYEVRGWRKSRERVAAFEFTALPDSYAARTGRPDDVGVIGVALFRACGPRRSRCCRRPGRRCARMAALRRTTRPTRHRQAPSAAKRAALPTHRRRWRRNASAPATAAAKARA
jgi:hypothetical protein